MEKLLGNQFNTRKDLDSTVKEEAKKYGFAVAIKNSRRDYYVNYQCTRAGKIPIEQVSSDEPTKKKRRRTSKRCGCLWSLHATYIKEHDKFIIDEINSTHTGHELKQSNNSTPCGGITNLLPTSTSDDTKKNFENHTRTIVKSYCILLKTIIEEHIRANSTIEIHSKTEESTNNGRKGGGIEVTEKNNVDVEVKKEKEVAEQTQEDVLR